MKTKISDFQGQFKAYSVQTDNGAAYKRPGYGRNVDIGAGRSVVLKSHEAQELFGDTQALTLVNPGKWPGEVKLLEAPVHMITVSMTFDEIMEAATALSRKHMTPANAHAPKMFDIPADGKDRLSAIFARRARALGLVPLGQFFVTSRALLNAFSDGPRFPEIDQGLFDQYMNHPTDTVAFYEKPDKILQDLQPMVLFNEVDSPGLATNNTYYISGLYQGDFEEAELPVEEQFDTPLKKVMPELQRTMK